MSEDNNINNQILEYLNKEKAYFEYVDLISPFESILLSDKGRTRFKRAVVLLEKDGLIELSRNSSHRSIDDKYAGLLSPLSSHTVKGKVTEKGIEYMSKNHVSLLSKSQSSIAPTATPIKKNSPKKKTQSNIVYIVITIIAGVIVWFITSYLNHRWLHWY